MTAAAVERLGKRVTAAPAAAVQRRVTWRSLSVEEQTVVVKGEEAGERLVQDRAMALAVSREKKAVVWGAV